MRCALECPIEGKLRLPARINTPWFGGKHLRIDLDGNGFASMIRIEAPVEPDDMISMLVKHEPGQPPHFVGAGGLRIRQQLEEELKQIESTLGLFYRITRVRWEEATSIAVPETPEEEALIEWNNIRVNRPIEDTTRTPTAEDFGCALQMGYYARDLTTTMSFFREGSSDMAVFRYITAFFSFFFVIEGLYANGQFRGRQVRAEFGKSARLRKAIEDVMALPLYNKAPPFNYIHSIDDLLGMVEKPRTVEGITHMLVWIRGDLHHFVNNPRKLTGSPLSHQRYEILASFTHDVCLNILMEEVLARYPRTATLGTQYFPGNFA